jgi:hypothetical protein
MFWIKANVQGRVGLGDSCPPVAVRTLPVSVSSVGDQNSPRETLLTAHPDRVRFECVRILHLDVDDLPLLRRAVHARHSDRILRHRLSRRNLPP